MTSIDPNGDSLRLGVIVGDQGWLKKEGLNVTGIAQQGAYTSFHRMSF